MEDECPKCGPPGLPAWMGTFADLMSLLMCFFVLLLSFAVMDAEKFKQIAGSMKTAFGVQKQIEAESIPMGTSVVKQEFSPGTPDPTPLNQIRQRSSQDAQADEELAKAAAAMEAQAEAEAKADELKAALEEQINEGLLSIEVEGTKVIIRVHEKGSFGSGSAELDEGFIPVMKTIVTALKDTNGRIVVAGHTDDIPISTQRYRSNWELSAARAVSVVHELVVGEGVAANRVVVEGRAETDPLLSNDTWENRAKNRRVEIVLEQEPKMPSDDIERPSEALGSPIQPFGPRPLTFGLNVGGISTPASPGKGARVIGISRSFKQ